MVDPSAPQQVGSGPAVNPFVREYAGYRDAGWHVLVLPAGQKSPPPSGFTGQDGAIATTEQAWDWAQRGGGNIGLRIPRGVVGIDVDHYGAKVGADTLAALEKTLGKLPSTWTSTARGAKQPSRVHFYRLPSEDLRLAGGAGQDIDVLQWHHRYVVAWPSVHPDGGTYAWYRPGGGEPDIAFLPPKVAALPMLPAAWVEHLSEGAAGPSKQAAAPQDGQVLLYVLYADLRDVCAHLRDVLTRAALDLRNRPEGSRHDGIVKAVHAVVMLGANGHAGTATALRLLEELWEELVGTDQARMQEFTRAVEGSARKAVTDIGRTSPVATDPCEHEAALQAAFAANGGRQGRPQPDVAPSGVVRIPVFEPTEAFTPAARNDQELGVAVIADVAPWARYARDSGSWVVAAGDRWRERKIRGASVVTLASVRLPKGNAKAEKDTPEHDAHLLRERFMKAGGNGAIGGMVNNVAEAAADPYGLEIADLDTNPNVLWAGGQPWDLAASVGELKIADLDPRTPHLHTAACAPVEGPTPLWDAFVKAVWPDPEVRAWALRVLSVGLTGHSPRVMPLLTGEKGVGKTQVVELLAQALGTYAGVADAKLLGAGDHHGSIVYALKGLRFAYLDEAPSMNHQPVERLKMLTGGGLLTGNAMRANPVTFKATHTLTLMMNGEAAGLVDDALRDRAKVIPCVGDPAEVAARRRALSGSARDDGPFAAEVPGVLAALIREAAAWIADGTSTDDAASPAASRAAVAAMVSALDPVQRWIDECTVPTEPGMLATELHTRFGAWFAAHPEYSRKTVPNRIAFGIRLTKLGVGQTHMEDGKHRHLTIRHDQNPFGPATGPGLTGSTRQTDGFKPEPVRNDNPSSGPVLTNPLTGMTGSSKETSQKTNTTHSNSPGAAEAGETAPGAGNTGPNPSAVSELNKTGADQAKEGLTGSDSNPSGTAPKSRTAVAREAAKERAAAKLAAKVAARAEKLALHEGGACPLPAHQPRGGQPVPVDLAEAASILERVLTRSGSITTDVETSGYPIGHPDYALRTVQLGDAFDAVVLDSAVPEHRHVITAYLGNAPVTVAHSAPADAAPLAHAHLVVFEEFMGKVVDTAIRAKLADPAGTDNESGLKKLAPAVLGKTVAVVPAAEDARSALFKAGGWKTAVEAVDPVERSGWAQVDNQTATMVTYAASDVLDCAALAIALPVPEPSLMARESRVAAITGRVSLHGVKLDAERIDQQIAEREPVKAARLAEIRAFGVDNPGSNPQVAAWYTAQGVSLPLTKTGAPSVAKDAIVGFKRDTGDVGAFTRSLFGYRDETKVLSSFLLPWQVTCRHGDGRARPMIYTLGADTGRMSCVRPNLQQIPREGGMRECIMADEGYRLISADFSSVEVRVAAAVSGDQTLIDMVRAGVDLHAVIAKQVFGPDYTKANRYIVKRGVFGRIYGGGIDTLAAQVGVSLDVMQAVINTLDEVTPGVSAWSRKVKAAVKAGYLEYPTEHGRVIHLDPDMPHKAPNYIIQGVARELLVDDMIKFDDGPFGGGVALPVHDQDIAFVKTEVADEATAYLVECMTTEFMGVPITVEADAPSERWLSTV